MPTRVSTARLRQRQQPTQTVFSTPNAPTIVFLKVCSESRASWLASAKAQSLLFHCWQNASAWLVGTYVLMPDHLHLFCSPANNQIPLSNWVRYWKRLFTIAANEPAWQWQSSQWHRRMRTPQNYREQQIYMIQNPVRAGLAEEPDCWPYQGKIHELRW